MVANTLPQLQMKTRDQLPPQVEVLGKEKFGGETRKKLEKNSTAYIPHCALLHLPAKDTT